MTANTAASIAAGSHALEHDHNWLYRPQADPEVNVGPPPLGVSVIDHSLIVFGKIFPRAAHKHRLQMLNHFNECIRQRPVRKLVHRQVHQFRCSIVLKFEKFKVFV